MYALPPLHRSAVHKDASGPVHLVQTENVVVYRRASPPPSGRHFRAVHESVKTERPPPRGPAPAFALAGVGGRRRVGREVHVGLGERALELALPQLRGGAGAH